MRILMAVPKYPFPIVGGLERQAHELAKALVRRGHTVHVLSSRFVAGQKSVDLIDGVRVARVKWIELKPVRFLWSSFGLARVLYKLKRDVDLVHVHNISWFGAFITVFSQALGLPVLTKLPNIGESGIPGMQSRSFGSLRVRVLKRSDAIIAMTTENLAELARIRYPAARILKVTNGIPLVTPAVPMSSSPQDAVTAVFAGRLSPHKGLLDLLHAWGVVKASISNSVKLRIIGDGPQAAELRALTLTLELGEDIEFFGYCADVPAELAKADLFVLPSYAEGNSNAILEAMRAGLPIVATRVGGAAIQVGSEGERFLIPPGNRSALADRLLELIGDEALRLRLGAAMRRRIETIFAIDRVAATYEHAYELILSGRREQVGAINPALFC
jgi:glycosyltransferase involved in cell wall biosynthesis